MNGALVEIGLVAAVILSLVGGMAAVRALGDRLGWHPEVSRKAIHVGTGLVAMAFPALFPDRWPVALLVAASAALMAWLRSPAQRDRGLGRTLHAVERRSWGDLLLALAVGFLFYRSEGRPVLYVLPLAVITLSDSAAALAGSAYGRRMFSVAGGTKSVEGSITFLAVSWLVAMVLLLLLTDVSRPAVVVASFLVALFGTLVEADSWNGLDNAFVPIGIYILLRAVLPLSVPALLALAGVFAATAVTFTLLAPMLGLSRHASRTFALVIFTLCLYAGPWTALMPIAAGACHLAARHRHPCRSRHPDIDFAAALAGTGCLWIFVGESVGRPLSAGWFSITYAGVAVAYVAIAWMPRAWPVAAATAAALALLALGGNLGGAAAAPVAVATAMLCATAVRLKPARFERWRSPRIAAVATLLPLSAFLTTAMLA